MALSTITTAAELPVGMRFSIAGRPGQMWEITGIAIPPRTYEIQTFPYLSRAERRAKRQQPQRQYGPPRRSRY